jgi:hypothetical protein
LPAVRAGRKILRGSIFILECAAPLRGSPIGETATNSIARDQIALKLSKNLREIRQAPVKSLTDRRLRISDLA